MLLFFRVFLPNLLIKLRIDLYFLFLITFHLQIPVIYLYYCWLLANDESKAAISSTGIQEPNEQIAQHEADRFVAMNIILSDKN